MSFEDLIGNERVKQQLRSYLRIKKIPSSMIFSGSAGCLKFEFARTFVKAMNCLNLEGDSCDCCNNCLQIDADNFVDCLSMRPDGQQYRKYQIDQIVELSKLMPVNAAFRVFIIHQAHLMNENAANAFLKTLEEPSGKNIFILLTENSSIILPTIKSRCSQLRFSPLQQNLIFKNFLSAGYKNEEAKLLSFYQVFAENFSNLSLKELIELRKRALDLINALFASQELDDRLLELYDISSSRENFLLFFVILVQMTIILLRDALLLKIFGENSAHLINFDLKKDLLKFGKNVNIDWILVRMSLLNEIIQDCQKNMNLRILMLKFTNCLMPSGVLNATYIAH